MRLEGGIGPVFVDAIVVEVTNIGTKEWNVLFASVESDNESAPQPCTTIKVKNTRFFHITCTLSTRVEAKLCITVYCTLQHVQEVEQCYKRSKQSSLLFYDNVGQTRSKSS